MIIEINDLETKRFGVTCAHVKIPGSNLEDINLAAKEYGVAMISTRLDVIDFPRIHALETDGYQLMDTLVYYQGSLSKREDPLGLAQGLSIRLASFPDKDTISAVAREAFRNYIDHFHADPRLDNDAADQVYVQWAQTSVSNISEGTPVLIAEKNGEIVGFLTMRLGNPEEGEIVLNGIHPEHQNSGIYTCLLKQSKNVLADLGAKRVTISTQINNYAAQKVWARNGLVHERSFYTFHKWYE